MNLNIMYCRQRLAITDSQKLSDFDCVSLPMDA